MTRIYVLIDPRTEEIRYVGKTGDALSVRLFWHLQNRETQTYRGRWFAQLQRFGLTPRIELVQEVHDDFWQEAERYWISYYRAIGCSLTNGTDGGDGVRGPRGTKNKGYNWTPEGLEARRLMNAMRRGKPLSAKAIEGHRVAAEKQRGQKRGQQVHTRSGRYALCH